MLIKVIHRTWLPFVVEVDREANQALPNLYSTYFFKIWEKT